MSVANILKQKGSEIISVKQSETVLDALNILAKHRIGAVLVMDAKNKVVGILSERDIVRALPNAGGKLREQKVSTIMTRNIITCNETDSIETVMGVMTENRIRHLPVMRDAKLIGVISIGDVVKQRIADTEQEAKALKQYITSG